MPPVSRSHVFVEATALKSLEARAETESLEALQEERRQLIPRYAELAAKFKGGTTAGSDSARKRHRALVSKRILIELEQRAEKAETDFKPPAENALERMANSDIEHIAYCEALEREFVEYITTDFRITEIGERIRSREIELMCYQAETRLTR